MLDPQERCVLDQLRVDEDGSIFVALIPPDVLSTEPLIQWEFGCDLFTWHVIDDLLRARLRTAAGSRAEIQAISHLGGEEYTLLSAGGTSVTVSEREYPHAVKVIHDIARKVAGAIVVPANRVSTKACGAPRPEASHLPNAVPELIEAPVWKTPGVERPTFLPGEVNYVRPLGVDSTRPLLMIPNRIRSRSRL